MKNRLRVLRGERGWSQTELARRLGVARQTINAIENARAEPSLSMAFDLAEAFGVRIEELFSRDEPVAVERPESPF